ncbi:polysaccharide lyase family 8 super-sandwich domain-containing protein [Paenibacillus qinlingensis]|uniref:Hyaluronate lyase n=1 Tax=Paenibacillus qinlingensis TaxID=1837343 RepID=A0ABU1NTY8_9BACL|nr:polysaccharide lyase family 8 super-sandwich domain-containing protein [Paenibacillus qinlingensis]MDR6550913.1 hyaluronate lyase [Paenibacillus qinlingensis]
MRIVIVKRLVLVSLALLIACGSLLVPVDMKKAHASDEFDVLREKYVSMLTSPTTYSLTDVDNAARITQITTAAQANWDTMLTDPSRSKLWNQYPISAANYPSSTMYSYRMLTEMALAYRTYGSSLMGNTGLKAAIIDGLDWLHGRIYYSGATTGGSNWWYWEIGNALALNDLVALMYDDLTQTQIDESVAAVNYFQNDIDMTGANRMWEIQVSTIAAILGKNNVPAGVTLTAARDGVSAFLPYVTSGDGFYRDGSFVQHNYLAYTGGYGTSLISSLSQILYLLDGSTWEVTDPNVANVFQWVYDSFEPFVYKGNLMDTVRGREISRYKEEDNLSSGGVVTALIQLSYVASGTDAAAYRSMVKGWLQADPNKNYFNGISMWLLTEAKSILSNTGISPRSEQLGYQQFAGMDRVVQVRPGYAVNVGMSSNRIMNYESINSENNNIWHVGDGMVTLYNNDVAQFNDNFWPTVDNYRLPGTTALNGVPQETSLGKSSWAGGTDMLGLYGVTGMQYQALGVDGVATTPDKTLNAKKSWFMFDDEIVALGSDINSTDGVTTETIVENRKINSSGDNALTVNGTAKSTSLGWSETMSGTNYIHLAGNVSGSDLGYYFPGGATIKGLRQAETGKWKDINGNKGSYTETLYTRNYMALWFDHGVNPTNGTYSYVMLPNKTSTQVASYAASPNITVLENSSDAQAVKEIGLKITGYNFWKDARKTVGEVTSDSKSSVMTRETASDFEVSVSDPTQDNVGNIYIEVAKSAKNLISKDAEVTILQYTPTLKFKVNVKDSGGKSYKVKFGLTGTQTVNPSPIPLPIPYEAETLPISFKTDSIVVYNDTNASGGKKLGFNHSAVDDYTEFSLDVTQAGTYNVIGRVMKASNNSIIQLSIDGVNIGTPIDTFWSTTEKYKDFQFGSYNFSFPGSYLFRVTTTGKNASASGYRLQLDYFTLTQAPTTVVVDNAGTGVSKVGIWDSNNSATDKYLTNYNFVTSTNTDGGTKSVTFTPLLTGSGMYNVYVWWPAHFNRATNIPVDIVHASGTAQVSIDQTSLGGQWNLVGTYSFAAGTTGYVKIRTDSVNGVVVADAVKFEPVP